MVNRVTIITVNFNNRAGLEHTIKSVVQQGFSDLEYIVIDGASTDGSVDVIRQYADKISFWKSEPDRGIYDAMNKGIRRATGEYVLFLNSGDYFTNSNILRRVFATDYNRTDLIVGQQKYIDRASGRKGKSPSLHVDEMNIQFFLSSTLPHQATFIRRDLFDSCGMYDETYRVSADWVFWVKAVVEQHCCVKIIPYYISFMESGGVSTDMEKCHNDMKRYLEECMRKGTLTWNDLFEMSIKSRKQDFCQRTRFTEIINRIIIWIGKHK